MKATSGAIDISFRTLWGSIFKGCSKLPGLRTQNKCFDADLALEFVHNIFVNRTRRIGEAIRSGTGGGGSKGISAEEPADNANAKPASAASPQPTVDFGVSEQQVQKVPAHFFRERKPFRLRRG